MIFLCRGRRNDGRALLPSTCIQHKPWLTVSSQPSWSTRLPCSFSTYLHLSISMVRMDGMDLDVVDYSLDLLGDQVIFPNPAQKSIVASFVLSYLHPGPVVSSPGPPDSSPHLRYLFVDSLGLDFPPLSPSTLNLLTSCSIPLFDPAPPADHYFPHNPNPSPP